MKDCCKILPGTVLAPDTTVPPFTVFGGNPGSIVEELSESYQEWQTQTCNNYYESWTLLVKPTKK